MRAIKLNDWNDVTIEAYSARLKTWINSVSAANIVDTHDAEGFIALQVHDPMVQIRRIYEFIDHELTPARLARCRTRFAIPREYSDLLLGNQQA